MFMMFCIYPIVAKHFEMFFRDVDNQFLDEVQSRNSFSNSFVVFVSGVHFNICLLTLQEFYNLYMCLITEKNEKRYDIL